MRISEVEIISMLTPASARAVKNVALMPGALRMPAPMTETLPTLSSYWRRSKPIASLALVSASTALAPSERGRVNEMSVRPVAAAEMFCTIMSMLIEASASVPNSDAA